MKHWWIWVKTTGLDLSVVFFAVAAIAFKILVVWRTGNVQEIDDSAYILSVLYGIAVSIVVGRETAYELFVTRSISSRRIVLILVQLVLAVLGGLAFFTGFGGEFGVFAYCRNCLFFIGVSLITYSFLFSWITWAAPMAIGFFFLPFSPEYNHYPLSSIWLYLKWPSGPDGLGWVLSTVIFVLGCALFVSPAWIKKKVEV